MRERESVVGERGVRGGRGGATLHGTLLSERCLRAWAGVPIVCFPIWHWYLTHTEREGARRVRGEMREGAEAGEG